MRKIVCLLITLAIMIPTVVLANTSFTDLAPEHWAYSYVNELVNDKTVNGYEDGTFKPNNKVTRAEFVKMIGKSDVRFEKDFSDVSADFWGYDYIMQSNMNITGSLFYPEALMTRNDVADLVWKRAGAVTGIISAPNTTDGFTNKDAAAWVYTYGIMNGDDGIHLRPSDGITRAEAAAIICRSREINENSNTINFIDKVSDKVLQTIFDSSHLFDKKYSADQTITNGEMVRAALRFAFDEMTPSYGTFMIKTLFENEYSRDIYVIGTKVVGEDKINQEYTEKNATVKDTIAVFAYCCGQKSGIRVPYGENSKCYPEISEQELTGGYTKPLCFAYENGITIYADGKIDANKEITHKEMALILLQCDSLAGINNSIYTTNKAETKIKSEISTDISSYPNNKDDYSVILSDIPNNVYEAPFANATSKPADTFIFTMDYSGIFSTLMNNLCVSANVKTSANIEIVFNPSMICKTKGGYTLRTKLTVLDTNNPVNLSSLIKLANGVEDLELNRRDSIYCDIYTGQEITDINIPISGVRITKVIK